MRTALTQRLPCGCEVEAAGVKGSQLSSVFFPPSKPCKLKKDEGLFTFNTHFSLCTSYVYINFGLTNINLTNY